jgi:hypothetical protein
MASPFDGKRVGLYADTKKDKTADVGKSSEETKGGE